MSEVIEVYVEGPQGIPGEQGGALAKQVSVTSASDLAGDLQSDVVYLIDGIIDMGTQTITVPVGGLNIIGLTFNVSKLISSEDNYTMFVSPVGGSGDLLGKDYAIEVTGTNSQVYDLVDANGFHAFEFARINYNGCTSLGTIDNYRQGLETGTGRFGGTPTLTLAGTWVGGFFIETSIVRGMSSGMTDPLFKAGAGFVMNSRFRSNQNIDLPTSAAYFDFSPSNFPNPNTVQLDGCIISRNGVFNSSDANVTPNLPKSDVVAQYNRNVGIGNTYVGAISTVTAQTPTSVSVQGNYYTLAGVFTATDVQHFDAPVSGQLRHLGTNPVEFDLFADLTLESTQDGEVGARFVRWDSTNSVFEYFNTQVRIVTRLQGARDVAFLNLTGSVTLNQNDYVFLEVVNTTDTGDITAETTSYFKVSER